MQSKRTPSVFNLPPGIYHVKVARSGAFMDFDVELRDGDFITSESISSSLRVSRGWRSRRL